MEGSRVLIYLFWVLTSLLISLITLPDSILGHLGRKNFEPRNTVIGWLTWFYIVDIVLLAITESYNYLRSPGVTVVTTIRDLLGFLALALVTGVVVMNIMPLHMAYAPDLLELVRKWTRWPLVALVALGVPFVIANVLHYHRELAQCRRVLTKVLLAVVNLMFIMPNSTIDYLGWSMDFYYDLRRLLCCILGAAFGLFMVDKANERDAMVAELVHNLEVLLQGNLNAAEGG